MRVLVAGILLIASSWTVAEVVPAQPVLYEVARLEGSQTTVIATGEMVLQVGRTVQAREGMVSEPPVGATGVAELAITAQSAGDVAEQVWLASHVTVVENRGTRRLTDEARSGEIVGQNIMRVSFDARTRTQFGDPSPIEIQHSENGVQYRLTLLFLEGPN